MARRSIYVESRIHGDLDLLWHRTQDPAQHSRWDLRFTRITYLSRADGEPQQFRYAVGRRPAVIAGTGVTVGERRRADGSRTSALRFSSDSPWTPIRSGSGYWRYVPTDDGIRFLTGYDYEPGRQGAVLDAWLVRPALGVMTAWSFDRLRLWVEEELPPERALRRWLGVGIGRLAVAGLVLRWAAPRRWPALLALAALAPVPVRRPSAARCLRRSPDRLGLTAPSTLASEELTQEPAPQRRQP